MVFAGVSLVWLFFLGGLGMVFPFLPLYLREHVGLNGTEMGLVVAMPAFVGMLAQPLWGHLADRTGRRVRVLWLLSLATSAGYALLAVPRSFAGILLAFAVHAVFATSIVPSLWSVTLALLGGKELHGVGWVRGFGTLGFGASVAAFPALLGVSGELGWVSAALGGAPLRLMFPLASALLLLAALVATTLPSRGDVARRAERGEARALVRAPAFLRVLGVVFTAYFFMQGPTSLFALLVQARGGGVEAVSDMWLLMLSLEVPLVACFGFLVKRVGIRAVMIAGIFAAAVRWLVSGYSADLSTVTAVQCLHGVAVAGILLGAPAYVDAVVPKGLRSTAQALLATIGFGLGNVLSSVAAGWLTDQFGPSAPARLAGLGCLVLGVLTLRVLPDIGAS